MHPLWSVWPPLLGGPALWCARSSQRRPVGRAALVWGGLTLAACAPAPPRDEPPVPAGEEVELPRLEATPWPEVAASGLGLTPSTELPVCPRPPMAELVTEVPYEPSPDGCPLSNDCVQDYLMLGARYPDAVHPVADEELNATLAELYSYEGPLFETPSQSELSAIIRDASNADFLLARLETEPLRWSRVSGGEQALSASVRWPGAQRLVIEDGAVGQIEAILLLPEGDGPFPGVVIAHGHEEDAESFLRERFGAELAQAGYAVLVPTLRANEAAEVESLVTRQLLLDGMSFMAVRAYEHLLMRKLLTALPTVRPCDFGLLGHSGGSVTGNLTTRMVPPGQGFAVQVSDYTSPYLSVDFEWERVFDDTVPELFFWSSAVADLSQSWSRVLEVEYGFPGGVGPVLDFLDANLR